MSGSTSQLQFPISQQCMVQVFFWGRPDREAIRHFIKVLELAEGSYPERQPEEATQPSADENEVSNE